MKKIILTMAILIGFTSVADAGKFTSGSDSGSKKDFERSSIEDIREEKEKRKK